MRESLAVTGTSFYMLDTISVFL